MQTKSLLYGLIGFFVGGLLVSVAATTFNILSQSDEDSAKVPMGNMLMDDMATNLKAKTGDDYDKVFIDEMIEHHEGAVGMAKLSATHAKHDEIKTLSEEIIAAQEKEISEMKQWQTSWGYTPSDDSMHDMHGM